MQLTKKQIIEETVAFYSEDVSRRAVVASDTEGVSDMCMYYDSHTGKMCAVGRCLIEPEYMAAVATRLIASAAIERCGGNKCLNPEYRGHPLEFWDDLQTLHDRSDNWDENGLTDFGKDYLQELLKNYSK